MLAASADNAWGEPDPPMVMSRRFRKAYRAASARLQGLIEGAIQDLVNRIRNHPGEFLRQYDRVAHLSGVIEADVAGARRLLFHWKDGVVHLLDVGGKEIVPRYTSGLFFLDVHQTLEAPSCFWPEGPEHGLRFFTSNPCLAYLEYGTEEHSEWLYFLSPQQVEVVEELLEAHWEAHEHEQVLAPTFIMGGPGTGKTSILVNLLKEFTGLGICTEVVLSQRLTEYIQACLPDSDVDRFVYKRSIRKDTQIVLIDDPANMVAIRQWLARDRDHGLLAVILAFDPCQLSAYDLSGRMSGIADEEFTALCEEYHVDVYGLDACYRQKANLGQATKKAIDVIAESTPFLAEQKILQFRERHHCLTSFSNQLEFPNKHGYLEVYTRTSVDDVEFELRRICQKPLWSHWPPLLVVVDTDAQTDMVESWVATLERSISLVCSTTENVESVKGLEFQHTFLFLGQDLFRQLESGFSGTGQAAYAKRRLIRIPYSRAKDSMVVFVT